MEPDETLSFLRAHPDYISLHGIEGIRIDLRYASENNFMGRNVYGGFNEAFLHKVAAEMLREASILLRRERPGWSLLVLDALRPLSRQRILWAHVEGTEQEAYVAKPERGSVHNFGLAVDLTCMDETDGIVDMGSAFDCFQLISQPQLEERFLATGELGRWQWENRLVLRRAMTGAGFLQLSHEWWHYDALPREKIRAGFILIA